MIHSYVYLILRLQRWLSAQKKVHLIYHEAIKTSRDTINTSLLCFISIDCIPDINMIAIITFTTILLFLMETAATGSVHPYIVFLNSSTVATSRENPSMSSLQNRSTTRIANKLSRIQNNRTSIPEIYSIGNFHWYVDSMDDADAQTLAQSEHVSHLHKDDPIFYMTELVQTDVPSWVRNTNVW